MVVDMFWNSCKTIPISYKFFFYGVNFYLNDRLRHAEQTIHKKDNGYIITSNNYETNISNVYAIGDVIKKDYYQLINASYEGMIAALDIINKEKNN